MNEDAPTNNVGGGNIAGVGVGPQGEPGFKKSVILRRKKKIKLAESQDSRTTLLNYITNSFVKLGNMDNVDQKAMFLLLAAAILANNPDAKSTGMAKRLAQLALAKSKPNA